MGKPENMSANQTEQIIRNETLRRLENIFRAYSEAGIEVQPTGKLLPQDASLPHLAARLTIPLRYAHRPRAD
jgi:hypothetical protein